MATGHFYENLTAYSMKQGLSYSYLVAIPQSPRRINKTGTGCQNPAPALLIKIFCFLIFITLY